MVAPDKSRLRLTGYRPSSCGHLPTQTSPPASCTGLCRPGAASCARRLTPRSAAASWKSGTTTADAANVNLAGPGAVSARAWRRRAWFSGGMQNAVGGIITAAVLALVAYLAAHFLHL